MKNILIISFFCLSLLGCASDNSIDTPDEVSTFNIELVPSTLNVTIEETFSITVNANEKIELLGTSLNNSEVNNFSNLGFGSSVLLYFNFDKPGQKIIRIRALNSKNGISEKQVLVNVTRGNTIKITGMKVLSFYNINQTWDPEYGANDPNRLADVVFGFVKLKIISQFQNGYNMQRWFVSTVKENQGDLTWDLTNDDLYIKSDKKLRLGLVDKDGDVAQDLLHAVPDYREISFADYLVSKPNTITYSFPDINLQFILTVEWPIQ